MKQKNQKIKQAVGLLKSLSHLDRLQILCDLIEGERSVSELQEGSALGQSAFSQHLAVLRKEGLVSSRRAGTFIYYSIKNQAAVGVLNVLHRFYCSGGKAK